MSHDVTVTTAHCYATRTPTKGDMISHQLVLNYGASLYVCTTFTKLKFNTVWHSYGAFIFTTKFITTNNFILYMYGINY